MSRPPVNEMMRRIIDHLEAEIPNDAFDKPLLTAEQKRQSSLLWQAVTASMSDINRIAHALPQDQREELMGAAQLLSAASMKFGSFAYVSEATRTYVNRERTSRAGRTERKTASPDWHGPASRIAVALRAEKPSIKATECARAIVRKWDRKDGEPPSERTLRKYLAGET